MSSALLPEGFAPLEDFVPIWVLPDASARMARRQASSIGEIRRFYDAIVPLGDLTPQGENLLKLMLALTELGPAVEWYDNPKVYDGFPIDRIRYVRQISDTAAQR